MSERTTYYVTLQHESGEGIGGRLSFDTGVEITGDAVKREAGYLVWDMLKELWER